MSLRASLCVLAFVLPAAGCVLLAPPIDHEAHCAFEGDTACAACLRESCQAPIDACCGDLTCAGPDGHWPVLDGLDACGRGDAEGCAEGIGAGGSTSGLDPGGSGTGVLDTAIAVRACVLTSCRTECLGDAVVAPPWSCGAPRSKSNACATCLYDACASTLDECCGDDTCQRSPDLSEGVGWCVGDDAPGCVRFVEGSDSGVAGKVRACVVDSCASACLGDGRQHQRCDLRGGGTYCTCQDAEAPAGPACSPGAVGGASATCVRGEEGCTCGHYACSSSDSDSCSCDFRNDEGGDTECVVREEGGHCCLKLEDTGFSCKCASFQTSCLNEIGEYDTPSCSLDDVTRKLQDLFVDECSN